MAVLASDAFTRADAADLGSDWTIAPGFSDTLGIFSNQADVALAGNRNGSFFDSITWPNDQYCQALIPAVASSMHAVSVRHIITGSARNYYGAGHDINDFGSGSRIWKEVASVLTSLGTGATTLAGGQTWYVEVQGTTVIFKIGGTQEISVSDSSLSTGAAALLSQHSAGNVALFDTFEGGDFAVATFEQEGYRGRNDDGSETTATWKAAQDTGFTAPLDTPFRVRILVNTDAADPNSSPFQLEFRKSGETPYSAVEL